MNVYVIRISTIDNLYADYMVEAKDIKQANKKAKEAFFRNYPHADEHIKLSIVDPNTKIITEIMNIIKEASNGSIENENGLATSNSK